MGNTLFSFLSDRTIRLNVKVSDWEDALRKGAQLLVDTGSAEPRYLSAIIDTVNELGPYVVIAPGLALGHAGPDQGAIQTGFSLLTLENPVNFGVPENDPVSIIFSFCAPNKEEHIQALRDLALFCCDSNNLIILEEAKDTSQVVDALQSFFVNSSEGS